MARAIYAPIHVRMGARQLGAALGGLRRGRGSGPVRGSRTHLHVHGHPPCCDGLTDTAKAQGARGGRDQDDRPTAAARCTAADIEGGGGLVRSEIRADFTDRGECPNGDHRAGPLRSGGSRASETGPHASKPSVGRAQSLVEVAPSPMRAGPAAARGRDRRDHGPRRACHARLLEQSRSDGKDAQGDGWLMTGEHGPSGCRRLPYPRRPFQGCQSFSGGTNIYPREVEEVLLTHPSVHEVSVVGRPLRPNGAKMSWPSSVATPGHGIDPRSPSDAHCVAHIARFKRPKDLPPSCLICPRTTTARSSRRCCANALRNYRGELVPLRGRWPGLTKDHRLFFILAGTTPGGGRSRGADPPRIFVRKILACAAAPAARPGRRRSRRNPQDRRCRQGTAPPKKPPPPCSRTKRTLHRLT